MYPIAPAITRTVSNTFEFAGYTIPAGETVIVATTVPHHLEQYFPEPERFDIDRYTPERQEHRQPGAFAPFGAGPHVCRGAGFAEVSIAATMATIVHEIEPALDPPDYILKVSPAPTPSPDDRFKFRVVRRRRSPAERFERARPEARRGRNHGVVGTTAWSERQACVRTCNASRGLPPRTRARPRCGCGT